MLGGVLVCSVGFFVELCFVLAILRINFKTCCSLLPCEVSTFKEPRAAKDTRF